MADSVTNDAFSGLAAKAEAMLGEIETGASAPVVDTPVVETTADTPVDTSGTVTPDTPPAATSAPQPLDVSPDTPVRIKVDGVEKVVTAAQYTELLQRNDAITQRHQALARQRQELEQHYVQREAQIQQYEAHLQQQAQLLAQQGDPVQRLVQQLQQGQTPTPQNLNEIATLGEVQQAMAALREQQAQELNNLRAQTQQEILAAQQQAWQAQALAQDQQRITSTVRTLMDSDDGKLLRQINPQAEATIRYNALQMGPQNVDQAIEYLHQYAKDWAGNVRGALAKQNTAGAVTAAKAVMEPPSGAAPTLVQAPKTPSLRKDGTVDWNQLRAQALSLMDD